MQAECLNQVLVKPPSWLRGSIALIFWRDLEVADGKFDWSAFDGNISKRADAGLQVQPIVNIYGTCT